MLAAQLVVVFLALLQGAVAHGSNQATIRIELNPDVVTVNGTCTDKFHDSLTAQLSIWFTDGVVTYKNADPQAANPFVAFENTVRNGGTEKGRLVQEKASSDSVEGQEERNLCSKTSCKDCCPVYCNAYCSGCHLCGDDDIRRQLRGGESRLTTEDNDWWSGDDNMQSGVAKSMEGAAQEWLSQNDLTQCMGSAHKLRVFVNYLNN
jgi:hypothetical protein